MPVQKIDGSGRRILVIDDDLAIRVLLQAVLNRMKFHVELAEDGAAGLERLQQDPPYDLILLDLMMPRMSGSEFRMVQKVDPQLKHLPVVLLSADGAMEEKAKALETDGALRKPIDLDQLLRVIERFRDKAA